MAVEIERKFLVTNDAWKSEVFERKRILQAYLTRPNGVSVRVRVVDSASAVLTIKSRQNGPHRAEFEYSIPVDDAITLLDFREGHIVSKVRHLVHHDGMTWEVDVFEGENEGLVIAEVELTSVQQTPRLPPWAGREITNDERYYNNSLAYCPYQNFAADTKGDHFVM